MYKVIIIDDEKAAIETLRRDLEVVRFVNRCCGI